MHFRTERRGLGTRLRRFPLLPQLLLDADKHEGLEYPFVPGTNRPTYNLPSGATLSETNCEQAVVFDKAGRTILTASPESVSVATPVLLLFEVERYVESIDNLGHEEE